MNGKLLTRLLCFSSLAALVACAAESNKIGSTIKGERIAVLEQAKALTADASLNATRKPELSSEVVNFSWSQVGYDSQHGMPHAQVSTQPRVLWKADIGAGSSSSFRLLARPVVDRNAVYAMDAEGRVSAFDVNTGKEKWSRDTTPKDADGSAIGGGLALDGDIVYATTGFGDVYALHASKGDVKWRKSFLKPLRAAPTIADGRLYIVSIDNDMDALDLETGEVLWHQTGVAESAALMGASSPAARGDSVVVAYNSGDIYSLRAQNGRPLWNYSLAAPAQIGALPAIADIRGLPVIDRDRVYAISHSGRIASMDERTGGRVWESDIGGIDTPVVSGDTVFVYGGESQLMALTRDDGRPMWVVSLPSRVDPEDRNSDRLVWAGPVLAGGKLWMVNSEGFLARFSPENGALETKIDLGKPIYLTPIVAHQTMFVVTDNGKLIALR